jgi:uncharacterized membrane protein/Mg-chelatase subunit ChlD
MCLAVYSGNLSQRGELERPVPRKKAVYNHAMMLPLAMRAGPLDFAEPMWLLGLFALVPIIYLWKTSRIPASTLRRWVSLILRCALVVAVVLALAGTRMVWFSKGICVVFVLDQSKSVPSSARDAMRQRIDDEIQKMSKEDQFVVVEFGGDAVLGSLPSAKGKMPPSVQVADDGRTDIARALRLALASFPSDRQKRIVLFSDGNQNVGDALREARIAAAQNVDVDVLLLAAPHGHEVMVEQLIVPTHVRKDANFPVRAIISSDIAQDVQILATRDGLRMPLKDDIRRLKPGTNVIDIDDSLNRGGYHEYQVTVTPQTADGDNFPANNTGYSFTTVDAPGKVLLVRGKPDTADYLTDALQSSGLTVQTTGVNGVPATVKGFAPYDCVILDDVNAFKITPVQQKDIADWVKDYGGGLVLIGGDDSFGPGGYKGTPLEEVAPVDMDVKRKKHLASLAMVIVNDKSGSMGAPAKGGVASLAKMDLANQGSAEVIKLLDAGDQAMVGAVDTEVKWMGDPKVIPMTPRNKAELISNILTVRAGGGGILCETALYHAYELVNAKNVTAMSKHVIMFSDTQDSEQQDNCVNMARENFARNGVTTSVIGMGSPGDPDVQFCKDVVAAGHGRFYITDDAMALPRLFAKEAFLVSRKPYVEKAEGITLTLYSSPLLQGFREKGVPKVYGYVGATLKPRATMAMHGVEADDPVLSHWVTGLGKCVAYTSDDTSRWGKDWVAWEGYSKFWAQVVKWVSRSPMSNGLVTNTVIEGSQGQIVMDAVDDKGKPINNLTGLKAKVIGPNDETAANDVQLEQVGPGRYVGRFPATNRGTYLVTVYNGRTNEPLSNGGGVLSYPPEYRDLRPNPALMHAVAETTDGQYLNSLDNVFTPKPNAVRSFWPMWQWLLIFLAAGLLLDVAWRRLNIADWFRRRASQGMPVLVGAGAGASVGALKSIKAARKDVDSQRGTLREKVEKLAHAAPPVVVRNDAAAGAATEVARTVAHKESPTEAGEGYANRLMGAKKRAAEQIREQSEKDKNT